MKRLLLPLIAALALPTAVNAESYWLILADFNNKSFEKIEMESLAQCEEQGYAFQSPRNVLIKMPQREAWTVQGSWKCLEGK